MNQETAMLGHIIFHFTLGFLYVAANPIEKACIGVKCPGPVKFYEDLECRPIYKNSGDCCAIKYDCGHLNNKSPDKCYSYGREYQIGEVLPENPDCTICTCDKSHGNLAQFNCYSEGFHYAAKFGCYPERNETGCYTGVEICPPKSKGFPKCEVDGVILTYSALALHGDKECFCVSGSNGESKGFCKEFPTPLSNQTHCGTETYRRVLLKNNCAPIFSADVSPQHYCNAKWRCQNERDKVIKKEAKPERIEENNSNDDNMTCTFGNFKMQIGDELNQDTDYESVCLKCICDIPPLLTCQYLPRDVCDYDVGRVVPYPIACS